MKTCSKCKELKDANAFSKDIRYKDGLYPSCKKCKSDYKKNKIISQKAQIKNQKPKACSYCKEFKIPAEFNRHSKTYDGLQTICKVCEKLRRQTAEYKVSVYKYKKSDKGKIAVNRYENSLKRLIANQKRVHNKQNSVVINAHRSVRDALKSGILVKEPCEHCGKSKVDAHHEDYNKPLDVIWLCRSCHNLLHAEKKIN